MRIGNPARSWVGVSLLGCLFLAVALMGGEACSPDETLGRALHAGTFQERLVRLMVFVTNLGGWAALITVTLVAAVYLLAAEEHRRAILFLFIVIGGRAVVALMKVLFGRGRPAIDLQLVDTHSMSFPSGHAANALITFLALALLVPRDRASRIFASVIGIVVALLVGASRVALGVHWSTDVIAGWAFGLFWILAWARYADRSASFSNRVPTRT